MAKGLEEGSWKGPWRSTKSVKHTEKTGAFIMKNEQGGIKWYRYQKMILIKKLLPFVREY
jgi:hypothetical protein